MNLPNVFSGYFTPQAVVDLWLEQCKLYRKLTEMLQGPEEKIVQIDYETVVENLHAINEAMRFTNK